MLTPNCFFFCSSGSILARWSTHTKISMGSSETEVNEFAVMPWILPGSRSTVTTVTPVEKWPRALRNSDDESGGGGGGRVVCSSEVREWKGREAVETQSENDV